MKKTDLQEWPSLDEQISEKKKKFEGSGYDMVYGQEAVKLLAHRKRIQLDNYIHGKVGTEQYKQGVINYLLAIKKHMIKTVFGIHQEPIGSEIFIDDNINNVFASKADNTISGVFAFYYNIFNDKSLVTLTFERFNMGFPEYSVNTFAPTGKFIYPYNEKFHDVYDSIKKCDTHLDIWNAIRNSCIKLCEVKQYRDCSFWKEEVSMHGLRTVLIPVFCFAHKDCQSIAHYMNAPHLYFEKYRVFKGENGKWGICIDKTDEVIVDCFFDNIGWGKKHVHFYKDGKIALCRIEEVEHLKK